MILRWTVFDCWVLILGRSIFVLARAFGVRSRSTWSVVFFFGFHPLIFTRCGMVAPHRSFPCPLQAFVCSREVPLFSPWGVCFFRDGLSCSTFFLRVWLFHAKNPLNFSAQRPRFFSIGRHHFITLCCDQFFALLFFFRFHAPLSPRLSPASLVSLSLANPDFGPNLFPTVLICLVLSQAPVLAAGCKIWLVSAPWHFGAGICFLPDGSGPPSIPR